MRAYRWILPIGLISFSTGIIHNPYFYPRTHAQSAPTIPPGILEPDRPNSQPLPVPSPSPPPADLRLPPSPSPDIQPPASVSTIVRKIHVEGSTIFSEADFAPVLERFIGRSASFDDLLAIRAAVTDFYTSRGYKTSGAFLPDQDVTAGLITVQVIEGELSQIEIQGLRHLKPSYIRRRLQRAAHTPLNVTRLEAALQQLQVRPFLRSVEAELSAGPSPGQSILSLNLKEAPSFHSTLTFENRDSPSVGSDRARLSVRHENLLGWGDRAEVSYGMTKGIDSYDIDYRIPINGKEGELIFRYNDSDSRIEEEPFEPLNITSRAKTLSIGLRQPLLQTFTNEFALGISADFRRSRTFFDGRPFSFSLGPDNGTAQVSVVRFSQDWLNRSRNRVLAARSQMSVGMDAFGATVNNSGVDGRFLSWLGQFQWVQSLGKDSVAIVRLSSQLSTDALLPLEQFSIGGVDTVRGYRQNQRVGDNGLLGSVELRVPIVRDRRHRPVLQLAPFFDIGQVWNLQPNGETQRPIATPRTLLSTGLGLQLRLGNSLFARFDWGIPLNEVPKSGDTLQDHGLHFSIQFQPF